MPNSQPNLYAFPGVDGLAPALRAYIIQAQDDAVSRHGRFRVAISGGSLPKTLAAALIDPAAGPVPGIDFAKWEFFFADERAVPLNHPESNYGLLKKELLEKIPNWRELLEGKVHTINETEKDIPDDFNMEEYQKDVDIQEMADDYREQLVRIFAPGDSVLVPIFDLLLLGCGPDGHTCSLFPGHELEKVAWVAPVDDSPKPPPKRITLTYPVIKAAERVAFVATGGGKKDIMKDIFDATNLKLPCAWVNDTVGGKASWFVDEPAVEGVSFPRRAFL